MLLKWFPWLAVIYILGVNHYCEGTLLALGGLAAGGTAVGGAAAAAFIYKKILEIKMNSVYFKLWTRDNLEAEIRILNQTSFPKFANFSPRRKTIILIHGSTDTNARGYADDYFQTLASAYLKSDDYNVIGVDWVRLTFPKSRLLGIRNAVFVGKHTSAFLMVLTKLKTKIGAGFEIVAHHYGTIAATMIGKIMRGRVIHKITGLAPQKIGVGVLPFLKYLTKNVAPVVEVIHTYGYEPNKAHRDIYINGGNGVQPGCFGKNQGYCSIRKAFEYFAIDVYTKGTYYKATFCSSYEYYLKGQCKRNPKISLFNHATPKSKPTGKYYIRTKAVPYKLLKKLNIVS